MGPAYFREAAELIGAAAGGLPAAWHDGGRAPARKVARGRAEIAKGGRGGDAFLPDALLLSVLAL